LIRRARAAAAAAHGDPERQHLGHLHRGRSDPDPRRQRVAADADGGPGGLITLAANNEVYIGSTIDTHGGTGLGTAGFGPGGGPGGNVLITGKAGVWTNADFTLQGEPPRARAMTPSAATEAR